MYPLVNSPPSARHWVSKGVIVLALYQSAMKKAGTASTLSVLKVNSYQPSQSDGRLGSFNSFLRCSFFGK